MPTIIDTRKAFRRLQDQGGFSEEQADAIVDLFADVDEQVATKGDIEDLRSDLKALRSDLEGTENDLRSDLKQLENDLRSDLKQLENDLRSDLKQTRKQIMTEMDARLAKLERRLLIVGIPALAALLAIFEFAL